MRETVKVLRRRSEYLIVNAASLHDADAQALCTFVDAVVLVVNQGVTTREELRQAYVEAERAGVTVLGALLEPPEQRGRSQRPAAQPRRARPPQGGEMRGAAGEPRGGERHAAPEASLAWADDPAADDVRPAGRGEEKPGYWPGMPQDEAEADAAESATMTTQALPQVGQQPRTGEARRPRPAAAARRGRRGAAAPSRPRWTRRPGRASPSRPGRSPRPTSPRAPGRRVRARRPARRPRRRWKPPTRRPRRRWSRRRRARRRTSPSTCRPICRTTARTRRPPRSPPAPRPGRSRRATARSRTRPAAMPGPDPGAAADERKPGGPDSGPNLNRLARGGALNLVGAGVAGVQGLALVFIVAHLYSQRIAGTFFAATSLFIILQAVSGLGTDAGLLRWVPRHLALGDRDAARRTVPVALVPVVATAAARRARAGPHRAVDGRAHRRR
ncbi:hypothetical protein LUX57_19740 [Actinomadura madurae]|uniref:hypothetical protein n=1 Tax=Actinomadura madurae TaxID=1993 RepID=UPI0020D20435|nr:hypothetical protein [Actinomadura madurae]MCP9967073.1 hypothetical protein [Actinomadura madurae]